MRSNECRKANVLEKIRSRLREVGRTLRDILYGMTIYEWVREFDKARGEVERTFTLIVFGELLGIPILPPYYVLRLLPYAVPRLESWRRSILRERDLTDLFDQEIG
ncbi:MAG TPA: hypothetical protein EYH30_10160 [Anaerolineales bacterium]|nr:hypothetical protein [Anaerolineae bacterium]HIQ02467.1 hypothetical protein [Anaerolineales bacterium]